MLLGDLLPNFVRESRPDECVHDETLWRDSVIVWECDRCGYGRPNTADGQAPGVGWTRRNVG